MARQYKLFELHEEIHLSYSLLFGQNGRGLSIIRGLLGIPVSSNFGYDFPFWSAGIRLDGSNTKKVEIPNWTALSISLYLDSKWFAKEHRQLRWPYRIPYTGTAVGKYKRSHADMAPETKTRFTQSGLQRSLQLLYAVVRTIHCRHWNCWSGSINCSNCICCYRDERQFGGDGGR